MKTTLLTETKALIEIPPFKGTVARFQKKMEEEFGENSDVLRTLRSVSLNGIDKPVTVRVALPSEFGFEGSIYAHATSEIASKNGMVYCYDWVPIRLAMDFESIAKTLPKQYLKKIWHVHMPQLECMTGDMFITGLGCPNAVFSIQPDVPIKYRRYRLHVSWIYQGRRHGINKDYPMLFQMQ